MAPVATYFAERLTAPDTRRITLAGITLDAAAATTFTAPVMHTVRPRSYARIAVTATVSADCHTNSGSARGSNDVAWNSVRVYPGATTMSFTPEGPHVVLSELTRALTPGETTIVTLIFEKSGGIGVITTVE